LKSLVGVRGFEPPAPASRTQCSTRLSYTPTKGSRLASSRLRGKGLKTPGFPNKPAGALDDQWIFGCEGVSGQCGIDAIFLSDAAARQASPGLRLCNHRESVTRSVGMERYCLPIRWLATEPGTG
jgi:hypothetical protein